MPRLRQRLPAAALACLVACAASRLLAGDVVVNVKNDKGAAVTDAVISLVALDAPAATPTPPTEAVVVAQQGQEFEPYVTAIVVGTRVSFPNQDKFYHQIYSLSKTKPFEIALHGPGSDQTITFDKPGIVAIGCNIHDWMSAYIVVLATPNFTKTPASGTARLADLAPGRYRLDVWHPLLTGESRRELVIAAGDTAPQTISVTLKPDRRIRRAPDGVGGGYK